ncbi:hypothetical protein MHYP_G00049400 [Metynnis hypsauchen]
MMTQMTQSHRGFNPSTSELKCQRARRRTTEETMKNIKKHQTSRESFYQVTGFGKNACMWQKELKTEQRATWGSP